MWQDNLPREPGLDDLIVLGSQACASVISSFLSHGSQARANLTTVFSTVPTASAAGRQVNEAAARYTYLNLRDCWISSG
jgi:hypothetical protein